MKQMTIDVSPPNLYIEVTNSPDKEYEVLRGVR